VLGNRMIRFFQGLFQLTFAAKLGCVRRIISHELETFIDTERFLGTGPPQHVIPRPISTHPNRDIFEAQKNSLARVDRVGLCGHTPAVLGADGNLNGKAASGSKQRGRQT